MCLCLFEALLSCALCPVCCVATLSAPMYQASYLYICMVHCYHCLPLKALHYLLLILCVVISHFVYYFMICQFSSHRRLVLLHTHCFHLYCMAALMMFGHSHAALPLACGFTSVKLLCLCHVAWQYLSACCCRAALQLPCCFSLSSCFTLFILPCHTEAALTMS